MPKKPHDTSNDMDNGFVQDLQLGLKDGLADIHAHLRRRKMALEARVENEVEQTRGTKSILPNPLNALRGPISKTALSVLRATNRLDELAVNLVSSSPQYRQMDFELPTASALLQAQDDEAIPEHFLRAFHAAFRFLLRAEGHANIRVHRLALHRALMSARHLCAAHLDAIQDNPLIASSLLIQALSDGQALNLLTLDADVPQPEADTARLLAAQCLRCAVITVVASDIARLDTAPPNPRDTKADLVLADEVVSGRLARWAQALESKRATSQVAQELSVTLSFL